MSPWFNNLVLEKTLKSPMFSLYFASRDSGKQSSACWGCIDIEKYTGREYFWLEGVPSAEGLTDRFKRWTSMTSSPPVKGS